MGITGSGGRGTLASKPKTTKFTGVVKSSPQETITTQNIPPTTVPSVITSDPVPRTTGGYRRAGASGAGGGPAAPTTQQVTPPTVITRIRTPTQRANYSLYKTARLRRQDSRVISPYAVNRKRKVLPRLKRCPMNYVPKEFIIGGRRVIKCVRKRRRIK